jgi:hypothetical protein
VDATLVIPRGVSLQQLEQGAARPSGFDTYASFSTKKTNRVNTYFLVIGIAVGVIIIGLIVYALKKASG